MRKAESLLSSVILFIFSMQKHSHRTSLGWRVFKSLKFTSQIAPYRINIFVGTRKMHLVSEKLHRSSLTTGCSESLRSPWLTTTTNSNNSTTQRRCVLSHLKIKKNDLATIFDDFAVIFDNFAAIFDNFLMILHIQRWLYNDYSAFFYDF